MAFPIDSSLTSAGYTGMAGNYIPEIWSGKLLEKFYTATVFGAIANTDYEGEISSHGDKVIIRTVPDMVIRDYKIGVDLEYDRPQGGKVELLIDKGKYYAFGINDVEKKQSDIQYMDKWSDDGGQQLKINIDSDILADIPASAGTDNFGQNAGKKSGNIDLGAVGHAVTLNKENIVERIIECGQVLTEQDVPEMNRWFVLPSWASTKIKISELADASYSGDGKSMKRNGRIGMIDNFELFVSNNVHTANDGGKKAASFLFGHKSSLTFASQLVENEIIPNPKDFGKLIRGLQVYGYEVIKPEAMGHLYATAA